MRYDDYMSDADAIMWNNERDPMLRSTILCVLVLDCEPDVERFAAAIGRSLDSIPRLRQHAVLDPLHAAPPVWRLDESFDLRYHVRRLAVAGDGSLRDLLDLAEPIAMQAFDKDRPLWELYQVNGLAQGRAAVLIKLHHSVSDGVGLVRMTASLVERSRAPEPESPDPRSVHDEVEPEHGVFYESLSALRFRADTEFSRASRLANSVTSALGRLATDPMATARSAGELAASVGRTLRPVTQPMSTLMTRRSIDLRFSELEYALDDLKRAGRSVGGTLNCAFVGGVAGGLRLYHERFGHDVAELRMTMPINVRRGERARHAGNQFAPARFNIPVGIADPQQRMRRIQQAVAHELAEPVLPVLNDLAGLLGELPAAVTVNLFGSMLKSIDLITSNVPGPPFPVYASGAKVEKMFGFGPLSGSATNLTLFSYDGTAYLGVNVDPAAVEDFDLFLECLDEGMGEVLSVAGA